MKIFTLLLGLVALSTNAFLDVPHWVGMTTTPVQLGLARTSKNPHQALCVLQHTAQFHVGPKGEMMFVLTGCDGKLHRWVPTKKYDEQHESKKPHKAKKPGISL